MIARKIKDKYIAHYRNIFVFDETMAGAIIKMWAIIETQKNIDLDQETIINVEKEK